MFKIYLSLVLQKHSPSHPDMEDSPTTRVSYYSFYYFSREKKFFEKQFTKV